MNEALYQTLLAVAAMCMGHFESASTGNFGNGNLTDIKWEKGFEQCGTIRKRIDEEVERRITSATAIRNAADRVRLMNALNGLEGKDFKPEKPEPQPKLGFSGCAMNTGKTSIQTGTGSWGNVRYESDSTTNGGKVRGYMR